MHIVTLLAFVAVSFVAIATPGPTVLLAMTNGSRYGVRRAIPGMIGAVLSDFVLLGAVAIGLGALLAASEFWFSMLKYVGAAYLAFLGIMMLRTKGGFNAALKPENEMTGGTAFSIGLKSFMVAVTNPKGYLFFSAFLPQFINPALPQATQYAVLAVVFASLDFLIMLGYAVFGSQAVRLLKAAGAVWLERACGGAMLALAGSLALYRRATT
ncbi:amino acid transporter [Rhizobium sp. R72]|uniref:LysE family translocator n=1 Tax=unclassified Rhizobium TaxID=2613769 RepID=UPI000B529548|nr:MULTISPECIES: LysE family translocator [unclassified Rhizobium]OWV83679.1 amino acid transporter [Rhizobium sp. R693]OWW00625.1 amino acid transporter [Rhizobium sp. R72]OWW00709.1 amino acid transporter [Rhizobium sp. R711]